MMGYENQGYEEAHLYASKEEMASLVLNEDPSPPSNGSKSFTHDPFSSSPQFVEIPTEDTDPLQSPSPNQVLPSHSSINSILEPPSYADAIFQSFDSDYVDSAEVVSQDQSLSALPSFSSDYIKICVSDPQKEQEQSGSLVPGGSYYFTYLITTFTNLPEFSGAEFNVRRRFRDVVTLSDRISESYRGYFIPIRPDKSVVESQVMQQNEFVEQRRIALEKYLGRLAVHPVLKRSEELRVFLTVSGKMPLARTTDVASRMLDGAVRLPKQLFGGESVVGGAAEVSEVVQPAKGGMDLLRIFRELKQSVVNDWGATKPPVIEEDKEFLEKKEKLQDLEQQISNVSEQAESLVKNHHDMGETMGQLGLAFVKLTKFESEEAIYDSQRARAADMKNVILTNISLPSLQSQIDLISLSTFPQTTRLLLHSQIKLLLVQIDSSQLLAKNLMIHHIHK
ncbi:sorting nexin 2B-like [Olea europaea var. sylvestris]|uniref:sorting nexin 2B-like n=1 Tax=Olea europaea var. sylvestris TaxID=158386 RepID=UPI000C1D43B2|nr:sorting nexin 2B-like [Olea europaea var. sylvestris]